MQLASMHLTNAFCCIYLGSIKIQPARRGILESPGSLRKHLMQIWPEYSTYKPKNCSTVKKGLIILMLTNELSFKRPIDEKITLFRRIRIHENEAKNLKIEEQNILSSLSLILEPTTNIPNERLSQSLPMFESKCMCKVCDLQLT